jgi:drug/metabolite transporter (DMT)-like permease
MDPREGRDAPLRALGFMLLAASSFAAMNAFARGLRAVPWPLLAFARALFGLCASLAAARARGASLVVRDRAVMWERSAFGCAGMLCTFYALTHMPLADATALLNTTPLWIAALARVRIGERASWRVYAALGTAFAGVVLVERPGVALGDPVGLVALGGGAAGAMAMVSLRRLSGESVDAVVVHFSGVATGVMAVASAVFFLRGGEAPSFRAGPLLGVLAMGLGATVGQFAMTRAYALDKAARVGAASFLQVLLALCLDAAVFRRFPAPGAAAGIGLIVLGGVALVYDAARSVSGAGGPTARPSP